MTKDMRETVKSMCSDAINSGRIPKHFMKEVRAYAETGVPSKWFDGGFVLSDCLDFSQRALETITAGEMWSRTADEVEVDGSYNNGFERRYLELAERYGIEVDRAYLDLCLIV